MDSANLFTALGALGALCGNRHTENDRVSTKADAMRFAINNSFIYKDGEKLVNVEAANTIYHLFVDNMELPDTPLSNLDKMSDRLTSMLESMKNKAEE